MAYSKYKIQQLIDTYTPKWTKLLKLQSWQLVWHIIHSGSKKGYGVPRSRTDFATSFFARAKKQADIVIYYDKMTSKSEVIATIIHELMHVRLTNLSNLAPVDCKHLGLVEERTVRALERFCLALYKERS